MFPRKLYEILNQQDEIGIEWISDGTGFAITQMDVFTDVVLQGFFRHSKYSSFQRQLNLYGFRKVNKGPDTGAYAHDSFKRGSPELLRFVRRVPQGHSGYAYVAPPPVAKTSQRGRKGRHDAGNTKTISSSAFSRLAACLKSRSRRAVTRGRDESDEEKSSDSEGEKTVTLVPTAVPVVIPAYPTDVDFLVAPLLEPSVSTISVDFASPNFFDAPAEAVCIQPGPLPLDVTDISVGVNNLVLGKADEVAYPLSWQNAPQLKQLELPESLEVSITANDIVKVEPELMQRPPVMYIPIKELAPVSPMPMTLRLHRGTSASWVNLVGGSLEQFSAETLDVLFSRQSSIEPPQRVEMER